MCSPSGPNTIVMQQPDKDSHGDMKTQIKCVRSRRNERRFSVGSIAEVEAQEAACP
jgi:hypothetical protein